MTLDRLRERSTAQGGSRSLVVVLGLELFDLLVHLDHVETLNSLDDLLERRPGERAGLVEDEDTLTEGHQRRDALDAQRARELLVGVGVELGEDDVLVLLRLLLVDGSEPLARATPVRPEVDKHDVVLADGVLEVVGVDVPRRHTTHSSSRRLAAAVCCRVLSPLNLGTRAAIPARAPAAVRRAT